MTTDNPFMAAEIEALIFEGPYNRHQPERGRRRIGLTVAGGGIGMSIDVDSGDLVYHSPHGTIHGAGILQHEETNREKAARLAARVLREKPRPDDARLFPDFR